MAHGAGTTVLWRPAPGGSVWVVEPHGLVLPEVVSGSPPTGRVVLLHPDTQRTRVIHDGGDAPVLDVTGATVLRGEIVFGTVRDVVHHDLWAHDPVGGTTRLVQRGLEATGPITSAGDLAYFTALDGPRSGLWRTDGSPEGTWLLHPAPILYRRPIEVAALPGGATFLIRSEIWSSDGTASGTRRLRAGRPEASATFLERTPRLALVSVLDGDAVLVRTDGSPEGTWSVGAFPTWRGASSVSEETVLHAIDERIVFAARDEEGPALFASNGTPGHLDLIARDVTETEPVGKGVAFVRADRKLLLTDGTPGASRILVAAGEAGLSHLRPWGPGLAFLSRGPAASRIGVTDGTPTGTRIGRVAVPATELVAAEGRMFLLAGSSHELWRSDGTDAGTMLLARFPTGTLREGSLVALGDRAQFEVDGALWISDGTVAGTAPFMGPRWPEPRARAWLGHDVFFVRGGLWRMDRRGQSARLVAAGDTCACIQDGIVAAGGRLLFSFADAAGDHELWASDGTLSGTHRIADICRGPESSHPGHMRVLPQSGLVLFTANDGIRGAELWVSDGTPSGTQPVGDIVPVGGSTPTAMTQSGPNVFFTAGHPQSGREPWQLPLADLEVASASRFATGCDGSTLTMPERPRLGTHPEIVLEGAPADTPALMLWSWHPTRLPVAGCELRVGGELGVSATRTDGRGTARVRLALPDARALVGMQVFAQVLAASPQPRTSDTLRLVFGRR